MSEPWVRLRVTFDHGRYHATPWGAHVNEGEAEWPPSPWRLVRALMAVSRNRPDLEPLRDDIDRGLQALIDAPAPGYVLPPASAGHTRHYVPSRQWSPTASDETDLLLDGFRVVDPAAALEVWWQTMLDDAAYAALALTASRLPYLGRSESLCTADLARADQPPAFNAQPVGDIDADGPLRELLGFRSGATVEGTAGLSVMQLRAEKRRMPELTGWVTYAVSEPGTPARAPHEAAAGQRPTIARYRVIGGSRPSLWEAVAVGEAVRGGLQHWHDRLHGGTSPTLSGHEDDGKRESQHAHAHYLATSDGRRIDHVTVWAREGFGPDEVATLARLSSLHSRAWPEAKLDIALTALGTAETLRGLDLCANASVWRTVTPIVLGRHPKRRAGGRIVDSQEDQIRRELGQRGYPEPTRIDPEPGPWHEFRARRATGTRGAPIGVVGARITFERPQRGPLALGALAHFGLGLLVPVPYGAGGSAS